MKLEALPWLKGDKALSIAVVGDLMLDEYLDGDVTRISPEAPVPVHLVKNVTRTAGGAANVARNITLVGGKTMLFGVSGIDSAAEELRSVLESDGISCENILAVDDRPTVKKTRIYSRNQQLVRIDWEQVHPIPQVYQKKLLQRLKTIETDAFLISDYAKGALTDEFIQELISHASEHNILTVVDPKGSDYSRFAGCDLITPNRQEACLALDLDSSASHSPLALAAGLQKRYALKNVLVTLGAEGMYLLPAGSKDGVHLPSQAREVYDVSGAGDAVAALMALGLAAKCTTIEAMHIANVAAGLVVEKLGTQPVRRHELELALQGFSQTASPSSLVKILSGESLAQWRQKQRKLGKTLVMTNGCFDLMHAGHVTYLEKARQLGDCLLVAVNSDESIARIKGPQRPIVEIEHRARVLAALGCVDAVVVFVEDTPEELIKQLVPDVLVKGADWNVEDIAGGDVVKARGGAVKTIDLVPGLSTSELIRRIKDAK